MEVLATTGQMGISCLRGSGVFLLNPSKHCPSFQFAVPQRPVSRFPSIPSRSDGIRAAQAREKEDNPVANMILEKELSFSPTFGDYVKILEAVKVDRTTNRPGSDGDRSSRTRRSGWWSHGEDDGDNKGRGLSDVAGKDRHVKVDAARVKRIAPRKSNWEDFQGSVDEGSGGSGSKQDSEEGDIDLGGSMRDRRSTSSSRGFANNSDLEGRGAKLTPGNDSKRWRYGGDRVNTYTGSREDAKSRRMVQRRTLEDRMEGANAVRTDKRAEVGIAFGSEDSYGEKSQQKMSKNHSGSSHMDRRLDRIPRERLITRNETVENQRQGIVVREIPRERVGSNLSRNARGSSLTTARYRASGGSNDHISGLYNVDSGRIRDDDSKGKEIVGRRRIFDNKSERELSVSTSAARSGGLLEKNADMDMVDDGVLDDRAAFKTFEVFTDVKNRPRVLRMEMEERIRNLAKWLNATDVNMPEWQFSRMIHSAKIKFTDHSVLRVIQILGEFGNWRRVLQVVEWFRSRERFKSYKSRYLYTAALDVLGKAKRPMEALNIFYAMREEKSSYPDLAAYHCIAVTLGQAGLMKELFDVIDCMKSWPKKKFNLGLDKKWNPWLEPDLVVYNAVLNACVQKKQWEGAFWVLQQLKQQGIKPSGTTYGLVMEVMLACEKYDLVYEFFKKVEKASIPCTLSYKVLVNALWRDGKIDEAVSTVENMEKRGIVGSASLYYDLARCLCSAGRCQEALMQMDKICKVATKPLVVTYTGLIQACVDSGNIKDGEYIYNEMWKFCSPNTVTCNIMLKAYLEHGMYEEAKGFFQKLLGDSHCINKKSDLKGKVIPDKFTFNAMIEAASTANKWDDFEHAFMQMLLHGFHFDKKRHLRMVMDAARAGKGKLLDRIWDYLVRTAREPPLPIVKERFCMKLREGNHASALSCLQTQQHEDAHAFSIQSWVHLLKSNADKLRIETIFELIREIRNLEAEGNALLPIYQNLLDACLKFLDPVTKGSSEYPDNQILFPVVHP